MPQSKSRAISCGIEAVRRVVHRPPSRKRACPPSCEWAECPACPSRGLGGLLQRVLMRKTRVEERRAAEHRHGPREQPASCQLPHNRDYGMPKPIFLRG